ncbi:hypothetical protein KJ590_02880 [Patescibacteria group bacterium]|nr:hypothetical protein [Patescibacteria group bacterium]
MNILDSLKIRKISQGLAGSLKNHPSWCLLVLTFLLIVYALVIFGLYAVNSPAPTAPSSTLQINADLYQQVLSRLKARDTNIQQGIEQNYPDIFR